MFYNLCQRQGKVLSGPGFEAIIDEVEAELRAEGLGIKYRHLMISSLLLMDKNAITTSGIDHLKKMYLQYWNMYVPNGIWKQIIKKAVY